MAWDYNQYLNSLSANAEDYTDALGKLGDQNSVMAQNAQNVYKEMLAQQQAGSAQYWSSGTLANEKAAAADFALRLAENGIGSLNELGQRTVTETVDGYNGPEQQQRTEYFNKATGEALPDWDRVARSGQLKLKYNLHFTEDGTAIPYTTKESSDWVKFRESTLKPVAGIALAAYGVPYVAGALAGTTVAGVTLTAGSAALTGVSAGLVSGGVSLLGGGSFEDALKNALVSGLTAGAAAGYADTIGQTLGFQAGSVASKAAGQAIVAGVKAGVTDENVLQSMATAAVAAYMSNKTPAFDATEREGSFVKQGVAETDLAPDFYSGTKSLEQQNIEFEQDWADVTSGKFTIDEVTDVQNKALGVDTFTGFDATEREGSLAKVNEENSGPSAKDIKTAIQIGGVLMASNEVIDQTIGLENSLGGKRPKDIYRNAPLAGFRMAKYEDSTTGAIKYVPFVGDEALLPPPTGYKETSFYAKGGFVSRRT